MQLRRMWRIRADMRNQGYALPEWVGKTSYQCNWTPDWDLNLSYQAWLIDYHTKFSYVPVFHDDLSHLLSSLSFLSSTLPLPKNMKLSHPSPWLHAMIKSLHRVQHTASRAYAEYCIHCVLHHPNIDCLPLPASLSSLGRPCCTQFCTFLQLQANQSIESPLPLRHPPELPPTDSPPPNTPPLSLNQGLQIHLYPHSITALKFISKLPRSWPLSASPNSLDHNLQRYLQTRTFTASKNISKLARSWPPISHDHGLQVHLQTRSITASECMSMFTR